MKKTIRKIFQKIAAISLCLTMLLNLILPIANVFAESYAKLSVSFESSYNSSNGKVEYKNTSGEWIEVSTDLNNVDALAVRISNVATGYDLASFSALRKDGTKIEDVSDIFESDGIALTADSNYSLEHIDLVNASQLPPEGSVSSFDGKAGFVWNCEGQLCIASFTGLQSRLESDTEYPINYIKDSNVVSQTGKNLDISKLSSDDYYWIYFEKLEELNDKNFSSWNELANYFKSSEENLRAFAIDPCGAENGANSIATNGDRMFRAIIYSNEFEGLTFGTTEDDYTYFPDFWDPTFFSSTVDISESTKENPVVYEAYLLEKTIKFKTSSNSKSTIKAIKALDVNSKAVSITKENDGSYSIKFNSNYYDKVIFELTAEDGSLYYIKIGRTVFDIHDNFGPDVDKADQKITAKLYYSSEYSYNKFKVLARITYADGTVSSKMLSASKIIDPIDNSVLGFEKEGGKGLKFTNFVISADKDIDTIDYTVIYDGALDGNTYGGTFAGSGKGATYNVESRRMDYK